MKTIQLLLLSVSLGFGGLLLAGCEESHTESDRTGWFGGHKHEETTVTKNPVTGDRSVKHEETKTP